MRKSRGWPGSYGTGTKIVTGKTAEEVLAGAGVGPDFAAPAFVRWIHRRTEDAEIYFVASNSPQPREVACTFRVDGLKPEFWRPETGEIEPVAVYEQSGGTTRIPIAFGPSGSVFVVFRKSGETREAGRAESERGRDPVVGVTVDGRTIVPAGEPASTVRIEKAIYGVPGDAARTRDVRAKLQAILDAGESSFAVSRLAAGDDPAYGVVKTLEIEYTQPARSSK